MGFKLKVQDSERIPVLAGPQLASFRKTPEVERASAAGEEKANARALDWTKGKLDGMRKSTGHPG